MCLLSYSGALTRPERLGLVRDPLFWVLFSPRGVPWDAPVRTTGRAAWAVCIVEPSVCVCFLPPRNGLVTFWTRSVARLSSRYGGNFLYGKAAYILPYRPELDLVRTASDPPWRRRHVNGNIGCESAACFCPSGARAGVSSGPSVVGSLRSPVA